MSNLYLAAAFQADNTGLYLLRYTNYGLTSLGVILLGNLMGAACVS